MAGYSPTTWGKVFIPQGGHTGHPANQELGITESRFIGHVVPSEQVDTLSREHEDESLSGRSLLVSPTQPQTSIKCCKPLLHACHGAPKKVVYKVKRKIGSEKLPSI